MFSRMLASKVALAITAIASGVVLLGGVAFGALGGASPFTTPASIVPLAGNAPLAEEGKGDRGNKLAEILDKLVQNGTITAEQKAKILAAIREAAQQARGHRHEVFQGQLLDEAAKIIGISVGDLRKELPGHSLAQVAQAHGVSRDSLVQKLVAAFDAQVDKALAESKLTKEQADKLKTNAPETVAKFVDQVFPAGRTSNGDRGGRRVIGDLLEDAARAVGITPADLKKELPGKSVAQVAQAHGVSRDTLVQKLTASATTRIDQALQNGRLTKDQADRLRAQLADLVGKFVDRVAPTRSAR